MKDLAIQQQAEALVLSCMDFRLTGAIADYMRTRGQAGQYDRLIVILRGASLI